MDRLPKIKKYYTLDKKSRDLKIVEDSIIDRFKGLIKSLETNKEVYLCTRGDNRNSLQNHNIFFTDEYVKDFFGVGLKSVSTIKVVKKEEFQHIVIDEKEKLLNELKEIIGLCNERIDRKPESHNIDGRIHDTLIEELDNDSVDELNQWKIFFLSFLHNEGSLNAFKSSSPFLSLTHGWEKYRIARNFSLSKNDFGKGIIYLYALSKNDPDYYATKEFTKYLKELDITWYEDKHKEIMLLNGMYPHYLLGFFEVTKTSTPKFVLNPALYELLEEGGEFDYEGGLTIDQRNFLEMAQRLGHQRVFFTYGKGRTFISDIEGNELGETIKIV